VPRGCTRRKLTFMVDVFVPLYGEYFCYSMKCEILGRKRSAENKDPLTFGPTMEKIFFDHGGSTTGMDQRVDFPNCTQFADRLLALTSMRMPW